MIHFVMEIEVFKITTEPIKPIIGEGRFIALPDGNYIFTNMWDPKQALVVYVESLQLEWPKGFELRTHPGLSTGRWVIEDSTLFLFGYGQRYLPFNRTKAEEAKLEIAAAFGVENVIVESRANPKHR